MPEPTRAYRLRSADASAKYHIVAAPNPKRARFHFAMHLKNSNRAELFLEGLKQIRCCQRAPAFDA